MVLAVACGGHDVTPPVTTPSDITSMNVGEVRLLNPTDIPNGINLQASTSARDYLIVVANTSSQHDVPPAPANDDPRRVNFAFVSCQNNQLGACNAYRRMIYEDERRPAKDHRGNRLRIG